MAERNHEQTERYLHDHFEKLQSQSPYEIFDVWEGCGPRVVKRHYLLLVREHHPDRYGGNVTPKIKQLSQKIFLSIQKAKRQLDKIERTQTVFTPPEHGTSSNPSSIESSIAHQSLGSIKSEPSDILSAETHSKRRADSITDDERPTSEERRALLAKLARAQEEAPYLPPLADDAISFSSPEELAQRRSALDRLAKKNSATSSSIPSLQERRQALRESAELPRVTLADAASSGTVVPIRGVQDLQLSDAQASFRKGFGFFRSKEFKLALPLLKEAFDAEPNDPVVQTFYAYTLFMTNRVDGVEEALRLLKRAIQSGSRQAAPDAYLFQGFILKHQPGRLGEAFESFKRVLDYNPKNVPANREIEMIRKKSKAAKFERESSKKSISPIKLSSGEGLQEDSAASFLGRFFTGKKKE